MVEYPKVCAAMWWQCAALLKRRGGWRTPSSGFAVPSRDIHVELAIRFEGNLVPPRHGACILGQKKCCQMDLLDPMQVDTGGRGRHCVLTEADL